MIHCESVNAWLNQFPEMDRELANLTLRHLDLHGGDEVSRDLYSELEVIVEKSIEAGHEIIIEPAVSREDVRRWLGDKSYDRSEIFVDFFLSAIRDSDSGSEKFLDLVVRSLRSKYVKDRGYRVLVEPDEVRSIAGSAAGLHLVIITDNIGSGNQIVRILEKIHRARENPSNPISGRDLHVTVLAWASTRQGLLAITDWGEAGISSSKSTELAGRLELNVYALRQIRSFAEKVAPSEKDDLMAFFSKYCSEKVRKSTQGMGYRSICSTLVLTGSSCPNTVPEVLTEVSASHRPLFPHRRIPADISQWASQAHPREPNITDRDFRARLRKQRLLQASERKPETQNQAWNVLLLAVAGMPRIEAIGHLAIPHHVFRSAEQFLIESGWISSDFMATNRGTQTVRAFGQTANYADYASARRFLRRSVAHEEVTYYPESVRGVW